MSGSMRRGTAIPSVIIISIDMAWHIEKETGDIIIDGWEKGISSSPYGGMGLMDAVDLSVPGEVAVGFTVTSSTISGATMTSPIARSTRWFGYGTPAIPAYSLRSFAILDDSGQVFESTSLTGTWTFLSSGNTKTGASAKDGLAYWMGYLWKFQDNTIYFWNNSTWATFTGSATITGSVKHYAYVASDNILYFTNGNYVGSLAAKSPLTSFDPTSSSTYTLTAQKLQLPVEDVANCLCEIGYGSSPNTQLLIGGIKNAIYPWDKTSISFTVPIYISDSFISMMVAVNQNVLVFTGSNFANYTGETSSRGRIYITNGSQANLWFKIPDWIFNYQDPRYLWGDAIFHRNHIVFGFQVYDNEANLVFTPYVWQIEVQTAQLNTEFSMAQAFHSISDIPGGGNKNPTVLISADPLSGEGYNYIVGWTDSSGGGSTGIGYSGTAAGKGSCDIKTDLIPVGTFLSKKTFKNVEYKLRNEMQSGESLSITPILDNSTTATALTFSPTAGNGQLSGVAPINFTGVQWLNFSVSLNGNSGNSGVRLREIRIR